VTSVVQRFGRFSLVGLIGAILQILLISLLTKWFGGVHAATPVAVEITILHNFIWHVHFTWSDRGPKDCRQLAARMWRFHIGNGLTSLVGNTILMYWLVERLKSPLVPTAIGGIMVCSLANFLLADRWVMSPATSGH
jgi:putative flippase GtrA